MLICPVCKAALITCDKVSKCSNGHCFDVAKEGYINLLRSNKSGDMIGDSKQSARSRRDFLNKGYYDALKKHLVSTFVDESGSLIDICCGEGFYTAALGENPNMDVYGFDISKEMIRLASKRGNGTYFVANLASIPIADDSFDYAIHLFAPFQEKEFCRILKPGGRIFTVVPGARHLWGLKEQLYDTPYLNDEAIPETVNLRHVHTVKVTDKILLNSKEDIWSVFQMTPYFYRTSDADKSKLQQIEKLETDIEFVIVEYIKA